jgi:hypothetical protein
MVGIRGTPTEPQVGEDDARSQIELDTKGYRPDTLPVC